MTRKSDINNRELKFDFKDRQGMFHVVDCLVRQTIDGSTVSIDIVKHRIYRTYVPILV